MSAPRRWLLIAGGVALAVLAFVLVWFQPQKLFIDERVDDALPTATTDAPGTPSTTGDGATSSTTGSPPEPVDLATGAFASLDHGTSGEVRVLELADGRRIVRLEGLDTDNGPDLYLYLSTNGAGGAEQAFDDDYVNLGRLKGNLGDQNYDLPADADLDRYRSVVIWCDRFNSAFGAADLAAA